MSRAPVGFRGYLLLAMLLGGTLLEMASVDLVLPAVPMLPGALNSTPEIAQFVIIAFIGGMVLGLLLFGALGRRVGRKKLLVVALSGLGISSLISALVQDMETLVALRFIQGMSAAAPAVFAPGIIKNLFDEATATRAIALLGSIEAIMPAAAPLIGAWLIAMGGWPLTFVIPGVLALLLATGFAASRNTVPETPTDAPAGSYWKLLKSPVFLRYAISQALVLGGLLMFVFGTPAMFVHALGKPVDHFIIMQIITVACFIIFSNLTGFAVEKFGAERLIMIGTLIAVFAMGLLTAYALSGGIETSVITALFALLGTGLGVRGPPGFLRSIIAGNGDDDRAASLVIIFIAAIGAIGSTALAPFVTVGLLPFAATAFACQIGALAALLLLPKWEESGTGL